MKLQADPARLVAVLVGIECYGAGIGELAGPAMDALRLAQWLHDQGVPYANLRLYINRAPISNAAQAQRRDALYQAFTDGGCTIREPIRTNLEEALDPANFPVLDDYANATLLVYFSGHGFCSRGSGQHYAAAADASLRRLHAIDLDTQLQRLRLDRQSQLFARQWILQDACGQLVDPQKLIRLRFAIPQEVSRCTQYGLYSARPGELSETSGVDQAGLFTATLLDRLAGRSLADLDLEVLYQELSEHFGASKQHPNLHRCDEFQTWDSISPGRRGAQPALDELIQLLRTLPAVNLELFQSVFRDIAGQRDDVTSDVAALTRELDRLVGDNSGLSAIERFALHLSRHCRLSGELAAVPAKRRKDYQQARITLDGWLARWPGSTAAAALRQAREQMNAADRLQANFARIVLAPDPDPASSDVLAWCYEGGEPRAQRLSCPGDNVGERLRSALARVLDSLVHTRFRVELILPLEQLFDDHIGHNVLLDSGMGTSCALGCAPLLLTLRVGERYTQRKWDARWRAHWEERRHALTEPASVVWAGAPAPLQGWYWSGGCHTDKVQRQALRISLFDGAAFAAWSYTMSEVQMQTMFGRYRYTELAHLLHEVAECNRAERPLACLIDDPDQVPPGASSVMYPLNQPH